jgi:hypothetical protein
VKVGLEAAGPGQRVGQKKLLQRTKRQYSGRLGELGLLIGKDVADSQGGLTPMTLGTDRSGA